MKSIKMFMCTHKNIKVSVIALFLGLLFACTEKGVSNYDQGVDYQTKKEFDQAEQSFKVALQKNPELAEAHLNLGRIYLDKGWLDGAETSTKIAIEIFERTKKTITGTTYKQSLALAYNNLGAIEIDRSKLAIDKHDFTSAKSHAVNGKKYFSKSIEFDPTNSSAQVNIQRLKDIGF